MATMPPYEATRDILFGNVEVESSHAPKLKQRDAAVNLAVSAYERSIYKSRTATVTAFLTASAFAAITEGSLFLPMAIMLLLAIGSAATMDVLARHEFVKIVRKYAKREGLSGSDGRTLATAYFAEWAAQSPLVSNK